MSTVRLTYVLPEDEEEFMSAFNGAKYKFILQDLDNYLRSLIKYQDIDVVKVSDVREKIVELLNDRGVSVYE